MSYKTSKDYDGLVKILDEYSLTQETGENTKVVYGKFTDKDGIVEHCLLFCVNCQYFMNCSGKMAITANSAEEYVIALKQHNVEFIDPELPKCETCKHYLTAVNMDNDEQNKACFNQNVVVAVESDYIPRAVIIKNSEIFGCNFHEPKTK